LSKPESSVPPPPKGRNKRSGCASGPEYPLGAADFVLGTVAVLTPAKRFAMRQAVVADPMALGESALGASTARGVGKLLPDYEEGRAQTLSAEHVEDVVGNLELGSVVEAEGDFHVTALRPSLALRSDLPTFSVPSGRHSI
jgi:hypothetical protein